MNQVTITLSVTPEGIYPNSVLNDQNFVCGIVQPTAEMALASIMSEIRRQIASLQQNLLAKTGKNGTGACESCDGEGRIVTGLILEFCSCAAGRAAEAREWAEAEAEWEARTERYAL